MLAALLLNPYRPSRRPRRWRGYRKPVWEETAESAKELYEYALDVVPEAFQVGILSMDGYAYLPPADKVDFEDLAKQADVLMALASEIEKQYSREAKRREEEDLLIHIFLN